MGGGQVGLATQILTSQQVIPNASPGKSVTRKGDPLWYSLSSFLR
jgi:hypothetical protein